MILFQFVKVCNFAGIRKFAFWGIMCHDKTYVTTQIFKKREMCAYT